MQTKKYWMVHNVSGVGMPSKMHYTLEDAVHEAHRLARHHMGNQITVLEVVDCYTAIMPEAIQVEVVELPKSV